MNFTQKQVREILKEIAQGGNGYVQLLKMVLESIIVAEHHEFNQLHGDSSNGFRPGSVIGHGGKLELVVLRSRHHNSARVRVSSNQYHV